MKFKNKIIPTLSVLTLALLCYQSASAEVKLEVSEGNLLYSGYYNENPKKNPEDPTAATIILTAPKGDGEFQAELNFNYFGCQKQNTGRVVGKKTGNNYVGKWNGKVDGTSQSGTFKGSAKKGSDIVSGNYSVSKGKQKISGCLEYFIAPNGSFKVEPVAMNLNGDSKQKVKNKHITLSATDKKIKASGKVRYLFMSVYWVDYSDDNSYTVRPVKEKVVLGKGGISFTMSELMKKVNKWPNQSKIKSGFLATAVSKKSFTGKPKFSYLFIPASAIK